MRVYSVYDGAACAFMPPLVFRTDLEAKRSFGQACSDPAHTFSKSLQDYTLYYIGEFSETDGELKAVIPPMSIARGTQYAMVEHS